MVINNIITDMEEAYETLPAVPIPCQYAYISSVSVAIPGPPAVKTNMKSKLLRDSIILMKRMGRKTGMIVGKIIYL